MLTEKGRTSVVETWAQRRLAGWIDRLANKVDIQKVAQSATETSINLYLHIPFCRQICAFCSFETVVGNVDYRDGYADVLLRHADKVLPVFTEGKKIDSLFIGGGTPSLLSSVQIGRVLAGVTKFADLADTRVTFELHPENVNEEYVAALQNQGVNRFSVGVQNLSEQERILLKRTLTTPEQDLAALQTLTDSGSEFNVDLIYGTPNQTLASWGETLDRIIGEINPPEITTYQYINANRSDTERQVHLGKVIRPGFLQRRKMYELTLRLMEDAGYAQTSTLSFSRIRKQDKLRLLNEGNDFLGLGPRTYSRIGNWFFINEARIRSFTNGQTDSFRGLKIPFPIKLLEDNLISPCSQPGVGKKMPLLKDLMPETITQIFALLYQLLK